MGLWTADPSVSAIPSTLVYAYLSYRKQCRPFFINATAVVTFDYGHIRDASGRTRPAKPVEPIFM